MALSFVRISLPSRGVVQEGITRKEWVNRQLSNWQFKGLVSKDCDSWPSIPITETREGCKVPPKEGRTE